MRDLTSSLNSILKFGNASLGYNCFTTNSVQDLFDNFSFLELKRPYSMKVFDEVLFRELETEEVKKLDLNKKFVKDYSILYLRYGNNYHLFGIDKKDFNSHRRNIRKTLNLLKPDSFSFFNPVGTGVLPFVTDVYLTMESLFSSSNISTLSTSNSSG